MTITRPNRRHARGLKGLLLVALVAVSGFAFTAAPASAASPCWAQVLNDWFVDGRIDHIYPIACYTQAQQHLGQDAVNYSGAPDDIRRALLAAIRDRGSGSGPGNGGPTSSGGSGPSSSGGGSGPTSGTAGAHKGPFQKAIDWIGPSNAESIPLPLLILAGIAFLLLAAAAASFVARRIQARRLDPSSDPPKPL
jgi:hypothetical protein